LNHFIIRKNDMFSEYLLSDWGEGGGGGGGSGGGGSDDNGCGIIVLVFLACLALSTQCNNSRVNENYMIPFNQKIEIVEGE
jgi:hypothetical protein